MGKTMAGKAKEKQARRRKPPAGRGANAVKDGKKRPRNQGTTDLLPEDAVKAVGKKRKEVNTEQHSSDEEDNDDGFTTTDTEDEPDRLVIDETPQPTTPRPTTTVIDKENPANSTGAEGPDTAHSDALHHGRGP